jgi:ABC-2 type transport system ATP-binding protein
VNAIDVRDLRKEFKEVTALDGISLQIKKGEVFGLLGPNGAGKTTLIRILVGLIKATSGEAKVFNLDVNKKIMEIRQKVSLLPQECQTYEKLTAYENIFYYGQMHGKLPDAELRKKTDELIDLIGLRGRENDLTKHFSGGMKRKVLVARAVVMDPDLIFLDEPTTGIDVLGARTVRKLIKELAEMNKTIILTTHDLNEVAELCDRVGILVKGKLVAIGSPKELEEKFMQANLEDVFVTLSAGEEPEEKK